MLIELLSIIIESLLFHKPEDLLHVRTKVLTYTIFLVFHFGLWTNIFGLLKSDIDSESEGSGLSQSTEILALAHVQIIAIYIVGDFWVKP